MRDKLEETLVRLHQQLESEEDFDAEQREMLQRAVQEIQETLDEHEVSSFSLAERLQEATRDFEHSHPWLTNTVGRIADLLSQLGI